MKRRYAPGGGLVGKAAPPGRRVGIGIGAGGMRVTNSVIRGMDVGIEVKDGGDADLSDNLIVGADTAIDIVHGGKVDIANVQHVPPEHRRGERK